VDVDQLIILLLATVASAVISNGVAIGSGIFLLPVLSLVFPVKIALGLGAPIMFASNIIGIKNYWREWGDWKELLGFFIAAVVGIFFGSQLINYIPNHLFKLGVAIFAISFALYQLISDSSLWRRLQPGRFISLGISDLQDGKILGTLIGFLGGVATVVCHAGGAVWSIYFVSRKMDRRRLVSTLLLIFAFTNLLKIIAYWRIGILSIGSTFIVLALFPVIIPSSNLGNILNKRIQPELFRTIVVLIILAAGISLLM
jgi:uncharacterized membrane protein YfcA